jgi:hypothetical protein
MFVIGRAFSDPISIAWMIAHVLYQACGKKRPLTFWMGF